MSTIIERMKSLGLTEYEVKAYLTMLEEYPINGYTLSKKSGIPRSRIYEVLEGLKRKQVVFESKMEKSNAYAPLEPGLLMEKLRQNFDEVIEEVDAYTKSLYQKDKVDLEPRTLFGREDILKMINVILDEATERVAISIWDEELVVIKEKLEELLYRGVQLKGIYFGKDNPFESLVSHRRIDRYVAEKSERYIIVIVDNRHVIYGIISRGKEAKVTWSTDPGIVEISDDFIAHDVMLNTYNHLISHDEMMRYERQLDLVRKDYYGYSDDEFELFPLPIDED